MTKFTRSALTAFGASTLVLASLASAGTAFASGHDDGPADSKHGGKDRCVITKVQKKADQSALKVAKSQLQGRDLSKSEDRKLEREDEREHDEALENKLGKAERKELQAQVKSLKNQIKADPSNTVLAAALADAKAKLKAAELTHDELEKLNDESEDRHDEARGAVTGPERDALLLQVKVLKTELHCKVTG